MEKIKKVIVFDVVVIFLMISVGNRHAYSLQRSSLRPMLLSSDMKRRKALKLIAAAPAAGFNQGPASLNAAIIQKDIENLYGQERENAKKRLIANALNNPRLMPALLEFVLNEENRAKEARDTAMIGFFSSFVQQLVNTPNASQILFHIFKYGINHKIRVSAIVLFAQTFMSYPSMQIENDNLPNLFNALIDPNMHHPVSFIIGETGKRNRASKELIIKELLSQREIQELRRDDKAVRYLDSALDEAASMEEFIEMFEKFEKNLQIQVMKRWALSKSLGEVKLNIFAAHAIINTFLHDPRAQEVAITILTEMARIDSVLARELAEERIVARAFGDTQAEKRLLLAIRKVTSQQEGLKTYFHLLPNFPLIIPEILEAIASTSDEALAKIELIDSVLPGTMALGPNQVVANRVNQIIGFISYPQYRDRALSILSRLNLNEKLKKSVEEAKALYPKTDAMRRQFLDKLYTFIKDPEKLKKDDPVSYKKVQKYLKSILGRDEDRITEDEYLEYKQMGLWLDISDLSSLYKDPDRRDIHTELFKLMASVTSLGDLHDPEIIKICIDNLRNSVSAEASAHILEATRIESIRVKLYLLEILIELRSDKTVIYETKDIAKEKVDELLKDKDDAETKDILVSLIGSTDNRSIQIEALSRLSKFEDLSAYRADFLSQSVREFMIYPETKEAAEILLKKLGAEQSELDQFRNEDKEKELIRIAPDDSRGDMIERLLMRHATLSYILRVAHETKSPTVRYEAFGMLSNADNLDTAFKNTPLVLETVVEGLTPKILSKITDRNLKSMLSGILLEKRPADLGTQDILNILEQEGETNLAVRLNAINLLSQRKDLAAIKPGYKTAQILINSIFDPLTRRSADTLLRTLNFDLSLRGALIRALLSEKIIADIKQDTQERNLINSILNSIFNQVGSMGILRDVASSDIDIKVRREAGIILKERGMDGVAFGGMAASASKTPVSRSTLLGLSFLRSSI